jgi:hypothetical protein
MVTGNRSELDNGIEPYGKPDNNYYIHGRWDGSERMYCI